MSSTVLTLNLKEYDSKRRPGGTALDKSIASVPVTSVSENVDSKYSSNTDQMPSGEEPGDEEEQRDGIAMADRVTTEGDNASDLTGDRTTVAARTRVSGRKHRVTSGVSISVPQTIAEEDDESG